MNKRHCRINNRLNKRPLLGRAGGGGLFGRGAHLKRLLLPGGAYSAGAVIRQWALNRSLTVSKLSNLLRHGVPDDPEENTDDICIKLINEKLKIVSKDDIIRSHRLGPVKKKVLTRNSKPSGRQIIIKFESICTKLDVFKAKRHLKIKFSYN